MRILFTSLLFIALSYRAALADKPLITVSKETTFVTEPVNDDGFVDLISAIDMKMSKGITTETNAAALIYPALGPKPDGTQMSKRFYKELGVPYPPEEGNYFETLPTYLRENGYSDRPDDVYPIIDQQGLATDRPWTRDEFPEIADWIDAQEEPLQQILKGIEREHYYCPLNSDLEKGTTGQMLIATLLPHIQTLRSITRVLACRAMLHAGEGRIEEGWSDLMASYRLGRHASRDSFLIGRLVGFAMEAITSQSMLKFIESTQPSEEVCLQYLKDLESLPEQSPIVESIDLGERLMFVDVVATLAYNQGKENFDIEAVLPELGRVVKKNSKINADWDTVLKNANQWYDRMVAAMKQDSYSKQLTAFEEIDESLAALNKNRTTVSRIFQGLALAAKDKTATTNYISDMLVSLFLPAVNQVTIAEIRCHQRFSNLQLALALAAYHDKHQEYPERLKQLTPNWLDPIPLDHFTDQPLKYSRSDEGYLLYSVGSNQADDHGKSFDEQKDDLVVRVPSKMSE